MVESVRQLDQVDIPQYLVYIENRIKEENERVSTYLEQSTRNTLITTVEQTLITPHVYILLERGFPVLMESDRIPELYRLYHLLSRVDRVELVRHTIYLFVLEN